MNNQSIKYKINCFSSSKTCSIKFLDLLFFIFFFESGIYLSTEDFRTSSIHPGSIVLIKCLLKVLLKLFMEIDLSIPIKALFLKNY